MVTLQPFVKVPLGTFTLNKGLINKVKEKQTGN